MVAYFFACFSWSGLFSFFINIDNEGDGIFILWLRRVKSRPTLSAPVFVGRDRSAPHINIKYIRGYHPDAV